MIAANHGHAGRDRTTAQLQARYFWYKCAERLRSMLEHALPVTSARSLPGMVACRPMKLYHAGVPMERVHLDFLGPLLKSSKGNEHILMMVDQFTKWVECIPLPSQTANEKLFSRFGYPS